VDHEINRNDQVEHDMITRSAAADLVGVNERTIDRWANEHRITRYKIGGMQWVRFKRSEIEAMVTPVPDDPFAE